MSRKRRYAILIGLAENRVETARREIGQLNQGINQLRQAEEALQQRQKDEGLSVAPELHDSYILYCQRLGMQCAQLREQRAMQETLRVEKQHELIEAQRQLQSWNTLQERLDMALAEKQKKHEQATLNEIALQRWMEARA